jgi:hypothetical protein
MPRAIVQFNDYVSLAVMLLMFIALLGGRSAATELVSYDAPDTGAVAAPFTLEIDGHIGDHAIRVGLAVVGEFSYFRGEDE